MMLGDVVVAGIVSILVLLGVVSLSCLVFAGFALVESFHSGTKASRFLASVFFLISAGASAFVAYNLVPFIQPSREAWTAAWCILLFPASFIPIFFVFVRRSKHRPKSRRAK